MRVEGGPWKSQDRRGGLPSAQKTGAKKEKNHKESGKVSEGEAGEKPADLKRV